MHRHALNLGCHWLCQCSSLLPDQGKNSKEHWQSLAEPVARPARFRFDFHGANWAIGPLVGAGYNSPMPLAEFYPTIQRWFAQRFGEPTEAQRFGWPLIRGGHHTLISAPTGTGKTLAAYLSAIDSLARQGSALPDELSVLYVSPLRALSNDVQKNLQGPLAELATMDPEMPRIRVLVRTGDTPQRERARCSASRRICWSRRPSRSTSC